MAEAAGRKILLKNNKRLSVSCCCYGICGKKLKFFSGINEYPLICWKCMTVNADS
jgi:hypothetical protein